MTLPSGDHECGKTGLSAPYSNVGGALTPANPVKGSHYFPHLSPDGRFVLFDYAAPRGGDIWLLEGVE